MARKKPQHACPNAFRGEGANGGCYFNITATKDSHIAYLDVGWSCVVVHDKPIPITWLSELIAIATLHKEGIAGFLRDNQINHEPSYALMCDPPNQGPE